MAEEAKLSEGVLATAQLGMAGDVDSWVVRTFELRRESGLCHIAFFSGEGEERREQGRVVVTASTTISPDESGAMQQSYVMILSDLHDPENSTYILSADTEEVMEAWLGAVQDAVIEEQMAAGADINALIGGHTPRANRAPSSGVSRARRSIIMDDVELLPNFAQMSASEALAAPEEDEPEEDEAAPAAAPAEPAAAVEETKGDEAEGDFRKEGFLQKQGGFVKNWKKRWFVLVRNARGSSLAYYTDQAATDRAGIVQIHSTTTVSEGGAKEGKKKFPFVIADPSDSLARTYYICASTAAERGEWMAAIQASIDATESQRGGATAAGGVDVDAMFASVTHDTEPTPREEPLCCLTYDTVAPVLTEATIAGWCDMCRHYREQAAGHADQMLRDVDALNWAHSRTRGRVTIERLDKRDEPKFLCFKITATVAASVDSVFDKVNKAMGAGGRVDLMPAGMQVFLLEDCMTSITHVSYRFPMGLARRQVCLLGSYFKDPAGLPEGTRGSVVASVDHPALNDAPHTKADVRPSGFIVKPSDVDGQCELVAVLQYCFHGPAQSMLRRLVASGLLTGSIFSAAEHLLEDLEKPGF